MIRFVFLLVMIIILTACSLGQSDEPFSPGTKVEMVCQEQCDVKIGDKLVSYVRVFESPGSKNAVGSFAHETIADIVESEVIDGVLYYKISDPTGTIQGWVTSPHVKRCTKSYC